VLVRNNALRLSWLRALRRRTYSILEREMPGDATALFVHRLLILLILCNVAGSIIDTIPWVNAAYDPWFDKFETFSLTAFAIEYALRLWTAPEDALYRGGSLTRARWLWMKSPIGLIDLLAIVPFIISQLFDVDLRVIVLLRLLRLFKIARYSAGFQSLIESVRVERHALGACVVILVSIILVSAGLLYVIEHDVQPEKFGSIPDAMWWAAATVSTVGYGDVVPVTPLGRIVGVFTMITGLLMLALPASIVATSFAGIINRHNFVVTAGMVARMPLFRGMEAAAVIDLLPAISRRTFDRNTRIIHHGEGTGSLHLITDGRVEIEGPIERTTLGPGGAFGGDPDNLELTARAVTRVKVLVIEAREIQSLRRVFPFLTKRIVKLNRGSTRRRQPAAPKSNVALT
jgi:voltage-gated potassium channel